MWQEAMDTFVNGDFLLGFFQLLMALVVTIVNIILWPISSLIKAFIPEFDAILSSLASYFDYASTYMGWAINALAIPTAALVLIAGYYLFAFTVTFSTWGVKLIIKWKQALWG